MFRKLASLKIESISPVSIGGYDTTMDTIFRTSSLKGVWRWWLRAYVAGVAWEKGLNEKRAAKEVVDRILGSGGKEGEASKITIRTTYNNFKSDYLSNEEIIKIVDRNGIPRAILLVMGEDRNRKYEKFRRLFIKKLTIEKIDFYERLKLKPEQIKLAFGSLVSALKLGGLGKCARRGFGSFKVKFIEYTDELTELANIVENLEANMDLKNSLKKLVEDTYQSAEKTLELYKSKIESKVAQQYGGDDLPEIPAICPSKPEVFGLYILKPPQNQTVIEMLRVIGRSTLRMEAHSIVAKLIEVNGETKKPLSKPLGFIMGLPRYQSLHVYQCPTCHTFFRKKKEKKQIENILECPKCATRLRKVEINTGYYETFSNRRKIDRRASPIIFSVLTENVATATLVMSKDWPDLLKWQNLRVKPSNHEKVEYVEIPKQISINIIREGSKIQIDEKNVTDLLKLFKNLREHLTYYFKEVKRWQVDKVF